MYYVLEFERHRFVTCDTASDVYEEIKRLEEGGTPPDSIEVVNCSCDDTRCSASDYLEAYEAENADGQQSKEG